MVKTYWMMVPGCALISVLLGTVLEKPGWQILLLAWLAPVSWTMVVGLYEVLVIQPAEDKKGLQP